MTAPVSNLHAWARYYASIGWHVFPLVPGTKSPFKGSKGSTEATTDLARIDAWWTAYPEANIATRPSAGGLYVYDVDPRNGGTESHAALQQQHGEVDSYLRVDSPGGGFHLYFCAPQRNDATYDGAPAAGIDGKYNGYAVLPPSIHPNGGVYGWADGVNPSHEQPTTIPAFLIRQRTARPQRNTEHAGDLNDVQRILECLDRLDPDDYHVWQPTIASIRHWEEHTEDAEGVGYELARQWSERSPKHDDGQFEDKWNNHDSFKAGARTLGSLVHDAGLAASQRTPVDAAAVFNSFPPSTPALTGTQPSAVPGVTGSGADIVPPVPAYNWTTEPVSLFKGETDPAACLAELQNSDTRDFCKRWTEGDFASILDDVCWKVGGNCDAALQVILFHPAAADTHELRAWIAHNCANRTTWATVGRLTAEQVAAGKHLIEVDDGKLVSAERAIVKALPTFPNLFQRNQQLVSVLPDGRILKHTLNTIASEVETHMRVEKGGKGQPAKLPGELMRRVVEREWFPGVGEIKAAVPLPVVRADGSVASEQGLDERTGLYVLKGGFRAPQLLTTEGMAAALQRVWAPFAEFPFADQNAKAVCLAAMFTAVCRPALPTAPAFLVNAQVFGTGKTLLSSALLWLTGERPRISSIGREQAEQEKVLTSILDAGPLTIMFDNVMKYLDASSALCMALTAEEYSGRLLGKSQMLKLPNRAMWVLNGNNVSVSGDMVRRLLPINLCSDESPELRKHAFDPVTVIREGLDGLRGDLIDLLYTYSTYGREDTRRRIGGYASFEEWNALVRGAVVWLGWGDPISEMQAQQDADPEVGKLEMLMSAWEQRFGDAGKTAYELHNEPLDPVACPLWLEAIGAVNTDKHGKLNPNRLPWFLRDMKGRALGGRKFVGSYDRLKRTVWRLEKL
jgi:hypothetical protein